MSLYKTASAASNYIETRHLSMTTASVGDMIKVVNPSHMSYEYLNMIRNSVPVYLDLSAQFSHILANVAAYRVAYILISRTRFLTPDRLRAVEQFLISLVRERRALNIPNFW